VSISSDSTKSLSQPADALETTAFEAKARRSRGRDQKNDLRGVTNDSNTVPQEPNLNHADNDPSLSPPNLSYSS